MFFGVKETGERHPSSAAAAATNQNQNTTKQPVRHVAALELGEEPAAARAAEALHGGDAALAHGRGVVAKRELDALGDEFLFFCVLFVWCF